MIYKIQHIINLTNNIIGDIICVESESFYGTLYNVHNCDLYGRIGVSRITVTLAVVWMLLLVISNFFC